MSAITRYKFSNIIASDGDAIRNRYGSKLIEAEISSISNGYIAIAANSDRNPAIKVKGDADNLGFDIVVKGSESLNIYSDSRIGSLIVLNTSGFGFGFKANEMSQSKNFFKFPAELPSSEKGIKTDADGNLSFFTIGAVSSSFDLQLISQKKNGDEFVLATYTFGLNLLKYNFDDLRSLSTYHQNFLNGILQYGKERSVSSASQMANSEIDYMFDNDGYIYFNQEDVNAGDIIVVFGNGRV